MVVVVVVVVVIVPGLALVCHIKHCVVPAGDLAMRGTSERPAAEVCNDSLMKLVAICGSRLMPLCLPTPL